MHSEPYGRHLPMFPVLYSTPDDPLTEERIQRELERMVERAETAVSEGKADEWQYDLWRMALTRWAEFHYEAMNMWVA